MLMFSFWINYGRAFFNFFIYLGKSYQEEEKNNGQVIQVLHILYEMENSTGPFQALRYSYSSSPQSTATKRTRSTFSSKLKFFSKFKMTETIAFELLSRSFSVQMNQFLE